MDWECHACGHPHATLPAACERCGQKPEIVLNVWRCAHCGKEGIASTEVRCPGCGVERALGVETAVAADRQIEGDVARALAAGPWRYCAYCDVQVPPVDEQGAAIEACPTCAGALSEATTEAATEDLSAEQAGEYRKEATRKVGEPDAPPTRSPVANKRRRWPWVLGGLAVVALAIILIIALRGPDAYRVVEHHWTRTIDIERHGPVQREGWASELPANAYDRRCAPAVHHHNRVAAGKETVSRRVAAGRSCVAYGYKKRGGTSVKTCTRWKTNTKTVQETRTRYRQVPVMASKCRYTVDAWSKVRTLDAKGNGTEPRWPAVSGLADKERAGNKVGVYTVELRGDKGNKRYTCRDEAEWKRFAKGAAVEAETSIRGTIKALRPLAGR